MQLRLQAILVLLVLASACAQTPRATWTSEPTSARIENDFFIARLTPNCHPTIGCRSFSLSIINKTEKNIELNWNKTLYISGGQTTGGFMFEGVVYKDRNNQKPPDIVFARGNFLKIIHPNNLVSFASGRYGGWEHSEMPPGENGAYLSVSVDGKEISERLVMQLALKPSGA